MSVVLRPLTKKEIVGEQPSGAVNGTNVLYTTAGHFVFDSLKVYYNGQRLRLGAANDYQQIGDNQIMFAAAPIPGDVILVDYLRI